jgi:hypothetical protein
MATEGVKVLTGKRTDRAFRVLFFDLLENEWDTIAFGPEGAVPSATPSDDS